jgi:hypothetical protein
MMSDTPVQFAAVPSRRELTRFISYSLKRLGFKRIVATWGSRSLEDRLPTLDVVDEHGNPKTWPPSADASDDELYASLDSSGAHESISERSFGCAVRFFLLFHALSQAASRGPMMPISVYTFHSLGAVMHVVHHAIDHGSEML